MGPLVSRRSLGLGAAALAGAGLAPAAGAQEAGGRLADTSRGYASRTGIATVAWNEVARQLVADTATDPVRASRVYAYVALAQHDAVAAVAPFWRAMADGAAWLTIGQATTRALAGLYPADREALERRLGNRLRSRWLGDVPAGLAGRIETAAFDAADRVLARAAADGGDVNDPVEALTGEGRWASLVDRPPLRPHWGKVHTLLLAAPADDFPAPPPAYGSPEFDAAIGEVRAIALARTEEQRRIAEYWDDSVGTPTPPGHWNQLAAELIVRRGLHDREAVQIMALMNCAMMDAGIACWHSKYQWWLGRPSALDPLIKPCIGVPNFPAYPSGHASFSTAGSEVLAHFLPDLAEELRRLSDEAALSRVYGGIHYRFDAEGGQAIGRECGRQAIAMAGHAGRLIDAVRA